MTHAATLANSLAHMVSSTPLTHTCGLFYWIGITRTATYYVSLTRQEINFPVHQAQW